MSWKPRSMSLEQSIYWIVVSGFLFLIPAVLYGYGLHFRSWRESVDPVFFGGMFVYGLWSAIVASLRNRDEQMQYEQESRLEKNR